MAGHGGIDNASAQRERVRVKMKMADGSVLIVSAPRFVPSSDVLRVRRPCGLGFNPAELEDPNFPSVGLGVHLADGHLYGYGYYSGIDYASNLDWCARLNLHGVFNNSWLWGGELFNYVVRSQCFIKWKIE
jgi:hypothetical protein